MARRDRDEFGLRETQNSGEKKRRNEEQENWGHGYYYDDLNG